MKKLIVVANDGRQTGKTAFTRVLEQLYQRKGIDTLAIYTDAGEAPDESVFWDLEEDLTPGRLEAYLEESDALIVDVSTGRAARGVLGRGMARAVGRRRVGKRAEVCHSTHR